ncbi:MAG: hypothetical protein AB7U85_10250 [Alphaproteobacteria bacterium]
MNETTVPSTLNGLMKTIKKSKYPLAPIYEAISNSMQSISQKGARSKENPEITIIFNFRSLFNDMRNLETIIISDNGIGFTNENFKRFETFLDNSKGFNNRGTGRLQFLHRFDDIEIESFYTEQNTFYKRSFSYNSQNAIYNSELTEQTEDTKQVKTTLTFKLGANLDKEKEYYNSLIIESFAKEIKKHFLLYYHLENTPPTINIKFNNNEQEEAVLTIKPSDMPKPNKTGKLSLNYSKFNYNKEKEIEWLNVPDKKEPINWAYFKLSENDFSHNAVYLCSNNVVIEHFNCEIIRKNDAVNGYFYLTLFYGDVFDKNTTHSVDGFTFPGKKEKESTIRQLDFLCPDEEFLFFDTIKEEISKIIPNIYVDIVEIKKEQEVRVKEIAEKHGIPSELAEKIKIDVNDDEDKVTNKLYKAQAENFASGNQKIFKIFEQLNSLTPQSDNYQEDLRAKSTELLSLIPQQNKEELSRYIIRREIVADILKKILNNELDYQKIDTDKKQRKDKEGLIHDLIFKRKSPNTESLNDLWILNEEFVHFEGCSDLPLNQIADSEGQKILQNIDDNTLKKYGIKPLKRPDIFLYIEEGKCILVELKAIDVDLSDCLNQMTKYCNVIANFSSKRFEKFFCYLIGENINRIDLPGDYEPTITGDWIKRPDLPIKSIEEGKEDITIATIQTEVIKLSSIYDRAYRRNKSFADKLGLRQKTSK